MVDEIALINKKLSVVIRYLHNHLDDEESTLFFKEIEKIFDWSEE